MALLKKSKYAEKRGVSRQYIGNLVRRGVIPVDPDGLINDVICDKILDDRKALNNRNNQEWNKQQTGKKKKPKSTPEAQAKKDIKENPPAELNYNNSYNQARALEMAIKAKTKEIQYKKMIGEYVEVKQMRRQVEKIGQIVRTRILKFPVKFAQRLEGLKAAEILEIMNDGVNEILEEFQDMLKDLKK